MLLLFATAAHADVVLSGSVEDVVAQARARGIEMEVVPSLRAAENRRAARWHVELRFPDDVSDQAVAAAVSLAAEAVGYPRLRIDLEPAEAPDRELKLHGSLSAEVAGGELRDLSATLVLDGTTLSLEIDRRARTFSVEATE